MKKVFLFASMMALSLFAACQKESMETAPVAKTVLNVEISSTDSRTAIGALDDSKRPVYWTNGDVIKAGGISSDALADLPENCRSAQVTFQGTVNFPATLLYPASCYKDAQTITLPEVQTQTPSVALYGIAANEAGAQMNPLLAFIRIPVKQGDDTDVLKALIVESKTDSYKLSGDFTIDYETGSLTPASGASAITRVDLNKELSKTEAIDIFVAVPAGENVNLSLKFMDQQGHCMTKTLSGNTFTAGKIKALPEVAFVPTTTEFDVIIENAADLVKFARDYNAGKLSEPYAKLAGDIVFDATTSAEFVATGGIGVAGDEDNGIASNYFNGLLDGQGHSIKSFNNTDGEVSVPIFAYTGSDGYIQNIVLDASCTISFPKGNAGPFVGRHKGMLKDCVNNADVNLAMVAGVTYFGGFVGRIYGGTVENCTMNGEVKNATTVSSTKVYSVGGIAGTIEDGGSVKDCHMANAILWGAGSAASGPGLKNGTLYLGLIAGNVIDGSVSGCDASSGPKTDVRGNATGAVGGIVGILQKGSVSECTNNQYMYVRLSSGTYLYVGGIVGSNAGTVSACDNKASEIGANGGEETEGFGGVCGINNEGGVIKDCNNSGKLTGPSQYTSIKTLYFGGIVGKNDGTVESSECITNSGELNAGSLKPQAVAYVGGIAGSTSTGISNCTNSAAVTLGRGTDTAEKGLQVVSGGIGYVASENELVIDNVKNTGKVTYSATSKLNGRVNYLGGIVGFIDNTKATVFNCINEGITLNDNFNNTYTLAGGSILGGIVGVATGKDADNNVTVTSCQNRTATFHGRRGISAGIVGYISYGDVNSCTSSQSTSTNNITAYTAGIAAMAYNTAISGCTATGNFSHSASAVAHDGGIVSTLGAGSSISGCTYSGKITTAPDTNGNQPAVGGIACASVEGTSINNCGFAGTFSLNGGSSYSDFTVSNVCMDTNFTGSGNYIM